MAFEVRKPKSLGKKLIPLFVIAGIVAAIATMDSWMPGRRILTALIPSGVNAVDTDVAQNKATNVKIELPTGRPVSINQNKVVRGVVMQWGAQSAFFLGNGGPRTTADSRIAKFGGQVIISNENDTEQIKDQLIQAVTQWAKAGGKGNPTSGATALIFMGDGMPGYLPGWNEQLRKVCKANDLPEEECEVRIVGSVGSSYGEDKHMVPVAWKDDPRQALASVSGKYEMVAAYFWDGDHVLGLDWAKANGLAVNPSDKTFDKDAVNFFNPKDYLDAVDKFIQGYCDDRPVVSHGKLTGEKVRVCVAGVDTWTPGDWNIAHSKKDILTTALSTRENRNQMSATVVIPNGWGKQHVDDVAAIFAGTSQAADMIKSSDDALHRATVVATQIYGQKASLTADDWAGLFKGIPHRTQNGQDIVLGGSRVWNLADNLDYYGLSGEINVYDVVYTNVGTMISQLDSNVIPKVRPLNEIFDPRYLLRAKEMLGQSGIGISEVPRYDNNAISEVFATKPYTINFDVGMDTIRPESLSVITDLYRQVATSELKVNIVGHTDNTGGPSFDNNALSLRRASAVRNAIMAQSRGSKFLPQSRFSPEGRGSSEPVNPGADQNSFAERAKNRRVVITLGR